MIIIFYHICINKRVNIHIYQKSHLYLGSKMMPPSDGSAHHELQWRLVCWNNLSINKF
jgi:hypothetical protein